VPEKPLGSVASRNADAAAKAEADLRKSRLVFNLCLLQKKDMKFEI
jgi:hypothetical protein